MRRETVFAAELAWPDYQAAVEKGATPMLIPARRRCGSPGPADHHLPLTRLEHGVDHAVYQRTAWMRGWRGCTRCPWRAQTRTTCEFTWVGPATLMATQPGVLLGANTTRARRPATRQSNRSAIVGYDAQEACTTARGRGDPARLPPAALDRPSR